ncbi:hypothetical protein IWQ52_002112 [Labrenzia sp. EL_159]|nr:hypothetical protein [Labrenzia sp. EL_162]MBG6194598.1 hypothetical protein [Labrenzia sp. EL_159]
MSASGPMKTSAKDETNDSFEASVRLFTAFHHTPKRNFYCDKTAR